MKIKMRDLSIRQPYAEQILRGQKKIEFDKGLRQMRLEGRSQADAYGSMGENQYLRNSDHSTRDTILFTQYGN
jgi:predicted transcriptional regulator